jgi:hypothetical protein
VYSFARSIVSVFFKLSHGSAVDHRNKKRGKSDSNEQSNEADIRQPLIDAKGLRENVRVAARALAMFISFGVLQSPGVTYPSRNVNSMM